MTTSLRSTLAKALRTRIAVSGTVLAASALISNRSSPLNRTFDLACSITTHSRMALPSPFSRIPVAFRHLQTLPAALLTSGQILFVALTMATTRPPTTKYPRHVFCADSRGTFVTVASPRCGHS